MQLNIENISKTYSNGVQALDGVSLTIPVGMFGLVGPNGSGKTTLMRTIATLQEPDTGSARLGDIDVLKQKEDVRRVLGYLPQEFGVYPNLTAETLLTHLATLKGITKARERKAVVEAMLQRTNLWNDRKKKLGGFSGGMRQRFGIAQALLGDPKLIIVDEPTAGLDPEERNRFLNLLSEIGENIIIILSTHIVDDVAEVCSSMAIIKEGRVLYTGEPSRAIDDIKGKTWTKTIDKSELAEHETTYRIVSKRLKGGKTIIHVLADTRPDQSFESAEPDLEDVYFVQLGNGGRAGLSGEAGGGTGRSGGGRGSGGSRGTGGSSAGGAGSGDNGGNGRTSGGNGSGRSIIEAAGGHTTGTDSGQGR